MSVFISRAAENAKYEVNLFVSSNYHVSIDELNAKDKPQHIAQARFIAYWLLKNKFNLSTHVIAKLYDKDRTTIQNGLERVAELELDKDLTF